MSESKAPVTTSSRSVWRGGLLFEAGAGGRTHRIDAHSKEAPSPVETLLNAIATCSAADVVDFLEKRRTPATRLEVDVVATRRGEHPRRVLKLDVTYSIDGPDVERDQAERSIRLSHERYCTVASSLATDIEWRHTLVLNGERGDSLPF